MKKPATVFAPSLVVSGNHPEHDAWRLEVAKDIVQNEAAIERLSAINLTPEHDTAARTLLNLQKKLDGWFLQSRMPHLVMLNHPMPRKRSGQSPDAPRRPRLAKRPFIVMANNQRQYWYGFDDFDDAALFLLKYR